MKNTIYEQILRIFPELKSWSLSEDGKEVVFTRKGRPLILPALVEENGTKCVYLDKTRYLLRHALFIYARKANSETGEMEGKSHVILFSPEDIYLQAIAETKYVTVWADKMPSKVKAPPARDSIIDNLWVWLKSAGLQKDKDSFPFIDKHGSKLVSVNIRMPGWRKGIKESWPTYASWEEAEKIGNLCPAYFDERDATGRHRMIREPDEKYCRAVLNIPYPDYLYIKRINAIAKNVIHHYHLLEYEEPIVRAKYNDIEGVNLITRFVIEKDSEELKYGVWDAAVVLTESAAKKIRYRKIARLKIFEPPEPLWKRIKENKRDFLAISVGSRVERFDQVLKQPDLPSPLRAKLLSEKNYKKIWVDKYSEYENLIFGEYGQAPISGTLIEYEDFYAIDSGERCVEVGDKLVSRTGIKGVVGRIVRDGKLGKINGKNVEMLIGRTKLYSKAALVKELQDSKEISGYPQIFVFLRNKIASDDYFIYNERTPISERQVLSDNFREACLTNESLYLFAMRYWQRDKRWQDILNSYLSSMWLQNVKYGLKVKNGEGKRIVDRTLLDDVTYIGGKEIYVRKFKSKVSVEKLKITKLPIIPPGRIEFIKRPRLNKMIKYMAKHGKLYKTFVSENKQALSRRNGIIREYILNGRPSVVYQGILVPIKEEPHIVHLNPSVFPTLGIRRGDYVALVRNPVIDEYSFGHFGVVPDEKIPVGCLGLSPSVMPAYSADSDGDAMYIYILKGHGVSKKVLRFPIIKRIYGPFKYKTEFVDKKLTDEGLYNKIGWTLVGSSPEKLIDGKNWKEGMKEWLLEGTWGTVRSKALSQYEDVTKDVEKYKKTHSDGDYIDYLNSSREAQYWTVVGVGDMRKKVVAYCQHLPPSIMRGILNLWDVELGMDKFKAFKIVGSPKVVWATLNTLWAYIQGKETKEYQKLTKEDIVNLKENFDVIKTNKDKITIKTGIPKNLDIETVFGITDPLELWNVKPTATGLYMYKAKLRESYRIDGLWQMLNAEDDFSPYACLFRNVWHTDLFDKHFRGRRGQVTKEQPNLGKTRMRIATEKVLELVLPRAEEEPERTDEIPAEERFIGR